VHAEQAGTGDPAGAQDLRGVRVAVADHEQPHPDGTERERETGRGQPRAVAHRAVDHVEAEHGGEVRQPDAGTADRNGRDGQPLHAGSAGPHGPGATGAVETDQGADQGDRVREARIEPAMREVVNFCHAGSQPAG
jgi:hypothetical protein